MLNLVERDAEGVAHIVGMSGGHDSSIMSVELLERTNIRPFNYVCTPTGDELPEMFAHWRAMGDLLGRRILPIMAKTLRQVIDEEGTLPNFRMRFCTRIIKILPYRDFLVQLAAQGPVVSYIGLRADEPGRAGKWRPVGPGAFPLAHAPAARVGRLRAYGNALDAETVAAFLASVRECLP